jgi:sulfur-carrier protein
MSNIINIKIPQVLQQYTDKRETVDVEGTTVSECLNELAKKYPGLNQWIFDPSMIVLLNKEVVFPDQMDTKVIPTNKIDLVPMLAGG